MNSRKGWSPLPIEGAFAEGDVNEVADNSESAERSKYEPFHHTPRCNVCLHTPTILVRHPPFVSGFRLSPALLGNKKNPRQDRGRRRGQGGPTSPLIVRTQRRPVPNVGYVPAALCFALAVGFC